jgi:hypothetical protein
VKRSIGMMMISVCQKPPSQEKIQCLPSLDNSLI